MRLRAVWLLIVSSACGARSSLVPGNEDGGAEPVVACEEDADCDTSNLCRIERCTSGICQVSIEVNCDDGDECTEDRCEPSSGECFNEPRTFDLDGDGFLGPLLGFAAGQAGACGNDCDDTTDLVHPGGTEVCDGLDNDCNGVIDDGARYAPVDEDIVRVSSAGNERAKPGGLAFNGSVYGVTYTGLRDKWHSLFASLDETGELVTSDVDITFVNSDSSAGPLLWNADLFATAWDEARQDGNYEIYFNRLDGFGQKLGPDIRVTDAPDFSLHPSFVFTGSEYLLVWDDQRPQTPTSSSSVIYGQRLKEDGTPIGDNIQLTPLTDFADSASLGILDGRVGFIYRVLQVEQDLASAYFRTVDLKLENLSDPVTVAVGDEVTGSVEGVALTVLGDRFVISWTRQQHDLTPGPAVFGATLNADGELLQEPTQLTTGATFARAHAALSLGDRLLLVWAEEDQAGHYQLFSKLLDRDLSELSPRQLVAETAGDSLAPSLSLGPEGDVGILFKDSQTGQEQVYFTRLNCVAGK